MKSKNALGLSFILFMIGLPIISFASANNASMWQNIGLAIVFVGAVIPPVRQIGSMLSDSSGEGD